MNKLNESQSIKKSLVKLIRQVVQDETKDCFRTYKATVTSAPNGSTCSVQLIGQDTTLTLPYSSKVASVSVGSVVWVGVIFNDFRNAIVWETHNFR